MIPRQFLNTGPVGEDEFPRFMLNDIPPRPLRAAELRAANAGLAVA